MSDAQDSTSPKRVSKLRYWAAGVALLFIGLAFWGLKSLLPGLPEIHPVDLAAAELVWGKAQPADYDLTVKIAGRQTGELKVSVRKGAATGMTRNGTPMRQERTWEPWTVPGMFETLSTDFDNRERAVEKFGVEPGSIHMRCEFDPKYGFPKHYLHQIYGRHQDLEWTVTEFVVH
ncbi:MAG: hypothetical protein C0483_11705 [Pirellula sp.]|nr:hypothetical protein [Pirellula sp.]